MCNGGGKSLKRPTGIENGGPLQRIQVAADVKPATQSVLKKAYASEDVKLETCHQYSTSMPRGRISGFGHI